ncbi:MAG TPA: RiPP maturation radical SAM C-methyltransferase, partial [Planctomycetota bacterium]|nr:RiPP maturation radical SAM C-methyltransferase [Planctomycetota bacterium]
MDRITLITMPIVAVTCPSIGLTQLKDVTRRAHGDRVEVELLYLQHDFARYMKAGRAAGNGGGPDLYEIFCGNQMHNTGLGDWFFRQAAFPELPDNSREYFTRYYPGRAPELERFKAALLERRQGLEAFLDSLIDRYRLAESSLVGFSTMFQQNGATIAMARRLKHARPDLTIIVGGANCEPPMGQELLGGVDCIDYVFAGPALKSFPEFVGRHLERDEAGMAAIRGVLSRSTPPLEGREGMGEELDIDADVELGYSDFIESLERAFPGEGQVPVMFFETSRGCWWGERSHCTFCGLNGVTMEYRAMRPEKAVTLIQGLIDRYAAKSNYFFCVDNIMPTNYVKEVLPRIRLPSDAMIFYEVKANIDEEVVAAMAAAGVRKIQPGIESLATSTLKLMKKGSTAFVNLRLLKSCVRHRVRPQWNLLIGFPGEGADVYSKYVRDLDRLSHLCPPDGSFPVRFDRYSPYFVKAQEYGLDLRPLDYYRMTYPFDEASLSRLAYYFTDINYGAPYIEAVVQWLGRIREKTSAWLGRWSGGDFATAPRLYLARREGGAVVHDSRSGRVVEHAVD